MPTNQISLPTLEELESSLRPYQGELAEGDRCSICQNSAGYSDLVKLPAPCNHIFDRSCIINWFKSGTQPTRCPSCFRVIIDDARTRLGRRSIRTLLGDNNNHEWDTLGIAPMPLASVPDIEHFPTEREIWDDIDANGTQELQYDSSIAAWALTNYGNTVIATGHLAEQDVLEYRAILRAMNASIASRHTALIRYRAMSRSFLHGASECLRETGHRQLADRVLSWVHIGHQHYPPVDGGENYKEDVITTALVVAWVFNKTTGQSNDNRNIVGGDV